jgi:hypothetical protein
MVPLRRSFLVAGALLLLGVTPVLLRAIDAPAIALFNGKDLTGWYSFTEKFGRNQDPTGNFKVEDGVIHILGQDFGYISTEKSFENYTLTVEYKWGAKQFAPRATGKRDSGILYHFPEDAPDKVWPKSLECQVQETDTGDIWCIGGTTVESPNRSTIEWNQQRVYKTENFEKPNDQWNTVVVVARGDTIEHYVNGHLVNSGTKATVTRGKILLQAEGAEIYYRNVVLTPLE